MNKKPGVYPLMTNAEYHRDAALGSTSLKTLAMRTPAHWKHESENPVHKDVYDFGTAVHSLVLEDDRSGVEVIDVEDKRGNKWTIPSNEAKAAGKIPMTTAEWADVVAMRDSVMAHDAARHAFTNHRAEVSVFAEEDGLMLKARPDAWKPGVVVDLKSTFDATPSVDGFGRAAFKFGYFMSAAHYIDTIKAATGETVKFCFVNIEKTPPFLVSITELTEADLNRGRYQLDRGKRIYRECMDSGRWPGYPGISTVELPRYAQMQLDEMEQSE